jgi:hypothetical protein
LIIGVKDDSTIIGVPDYQIKPTVANPFSAGGVPIGPVAIGDRQVVYVHVGAAPPEFWPITTPRGKAFRRDGQRILEIEVDKPGSENEPKVKRRVRLFVAMSFREAEDPALVDYWSAMQRAVVTTALPIDLRRIDPLEGD